MTALAEGIGGIFFSNFVAPSFDTLSCDQIHSIFFRLDSVGYVFITLRLSGLIFENQIDEKEGVRLDIFICLQVFPRDQKVDDIRYILL